MKIFRTLEMLIFVVFLKFQEYVGDMPNEDDEQGDWEEEEADNDEE